MSSVSISDAKVIARVRSVIDKIGEPMLPIGINSSPGVYQGSGQIDVEGRTFRVLQCDSVLGFREALLDAGEPLVLLTRVDERELGYDVLGRLARAHLHTLQPWPMLRDLFKANDVAPRLAGLKGVAEYLLDHQPPQGFPPARLGKLDEETVWGFILNPLGLVTRPDVRGILEWAAVSQNVARYQAFSQDLRESLHGWISTTAGSEGRLLFEVIEDGFAADLIPLGVVIGIALGTGAPALRIRLEKYTRNRAVPETTLGVWSNAAIESIQTRLEDDRRSAAMQWIERGDALLRELSAGDLSIASNVSAAGLEQRFERFAEGLAARDEAAIHATLAALHRHCLTKPYETGWNVNHRDRLFRARMAARLVRWLTTQETPIALIAAAASQYSRYGAYADWARHALTGGDPSAPLSAAYQKLLADASTRRERENAQFALLLSLATHPGSLGDAIGVEDVVSSVIVPLARGGRRVLLLVMDGMSQPVFQELLRDMHQLGWGELHSSSAGWPRPVLAALPSVTEVSRASLLAGRLVLGKADLEKSEFSSQPALLEVSSAGAPPILFHKAALSESGTAELAQDVRDAIKNDKRKIVAVVVNAIDDFLLKGGQTVLPSTLMAMPIVHRLLAEAELSRRVVVLTSDHGHIIDRGTSYRASPAGGERFRIDSEAKDGEVLLRGARVVVPGNTIAAATSEAIRYTQMKKFGYHGGATPQECVVPLAVLSREAFEGWTEAVPQFPEWWESDTVLRPVVAAAAETEPVAPEAALPSDWVDALFASGVYKSQVEIAGRSAVQPGQLRTLLMFLAERKGVVLVPAVAHRLDVPELRVNTIIAAAARVMNVDAYPVLSLDASSKTVTLNLDLLRTQFDLEK